MTKPVTPNPDIGSAANPSTSPSSMQTVKNGIGAAGSRMVSAAADFTAKGRSVLYTVVGAPISWVWGKIKGLGSWLSYKIWGPAKIAGLTVPLDVPGWLWGKMTITVSLKDALSSKRITPTEALTNVSGCRPEHLTALGYDVVKFSYTWCGMTYQHEGTLEKALRKGYITIDEAISQKFITETQAIEGGWKQAPKSAKPSK